MNKLTKTKQEKNKIVIETRGRPKANVKLPKRGVFTVDSVWAQHPHLTKVTIGKYIKKAKDEGVITLIDKKINATNYKGQPCRYYRFGKIKDVKMTFEPKKPKPRKYKPKAKVKPEIIVTVEPDINKSIDFPVLIDVNEDDLVVA